MKISATLIVLAASSIAWASAGFASQNADAGNREAIARSAGADGAQGTAVSNSRAVKLSRTYMIGLWTDDDDCSDVIEFTHDGRFVTDGGNAGGLWHLEGNRLTMTGRATATIRIVPVDENTITVINVDGSLGRSTRC